MVKKQSMGGARHRDRSGGEGRESRNRCMGETEGELSQRHACPLGTKGMLVRGENACRKGK